MSLYVRLLISLSDEKRTIRQSRQSLWLPVLLLRLQCRHFRRNALCTSPMDLSQPHSHGRSPTPPSCYATEDAFLTTLAYCISQM